MSVISWYTDKDGNHVESGTGRILSTPESRAKEDIPQWKKFEIGRLEEVDGHIVPGPNALEKDQKEYGGNIAKTGLHKTRGTDMRPNPADFLTVSNINSYGDVEVLITYPDGYDELLGRAWIADDSHVSMRTQESNVVTITNADFLTFKLPQGYGLEDASEVKLQFYFRKENVQMKKSLVWNCVRPKNVRKIDTRKADWDVRTPWEKRLKVDFPGISHKRWSNWSDQDRDVYARIYYSYQEAIAEYGPRSKGLANFEKTYGDVLFGFARDGKPMPAKYIDEHYSPAGITENTEVVWEQPKIDGLGKWVAKDTSASAPAASVEDADIEAANRYREAIGLPPVKESQQDKLRTALVEVNMQPDVVVKEFNLETQQFEEIEGKQQAKVRVSSTKIMPNDDNYTTLEKALNWAAETHHGPDHQERWNRISAALGADNGFTPMSMNEIKKWWNHFGQNARWTMAMNALGAQDKVKDREEEMAQYNSKLSMQGSFSVEQWKQRYNRDPVICQFEGYDDLTIYSDAARMPNWWLDGPGEPTQLWRLEQNGEMVLVKDLVSESTATDTVTVPLDMAEAIRDGDWDRVAALARMQV